MMASQRQGRRYLAGLAIFLSLAFMIVGTLGPAHRSPYFLAIVPLPGLIALFLGWQAWRSEEKSNGYAASALLLLVFVLVFSHLLPRSHA